MAYTSSDWHLQRMLAPSVCVTVGKTPGTTTNDGPAMDLVSQA